MNIVKIDEQQTMNSREIAELISKRHDHVLRDIDNLIKKLGPEGFHTTTYADANGVQRRMYEMGISQVMSLMSRYDVILFSKAFDKFLDDKYRTILTIRNVLQAIQQFEVPEDVEDMYVYAIRNKTTGNIKLGISRNPEQRLKQLQTGNDCKLELVAYRKAENSFKDESLLHYENRDHHIRGEWFEPEAIESLQAKQRV